MDLRLDPSSPDPIHRQIVDQVRHLVATGRLAAGDRLLPVRSLAAQLKVNVNTVARAYLELERMGVVSTAHGRGTFVAGEAPASVVDFREERLRGILGKAVLEALSLGYSQVQVEGAMALQLARWRELRSVEVDTAAEGAAEPASVLRIAGSHDLALDLLIGQLARSRPELSVVPSYVGSLAGLIALERGEAEMAGCHLLDEETGEYNLPFVRRILPGEEMLLVNLAHRRQGLIVARGNPKGIHGLEDLARPEIVMVNRQRGAGTRVLLDLRLAQLKIRSEMVPGYDHEVGTHTAVAAAIVDGSADVGLGILSAARAMNLDFIPLATERFDLAIPAAQYETLPVAALVATLRSDSFKAVVREMGGYDTSDTGGVVGTTGVATRIA
ncbi:MAG: substrate-binding domain-containing protein [Chloroflexota bacterium]